LELTYKIAKHLHKELINKVQLFKEVDISFLVDITPHLSTLRVKAGDYLYQKKDYPLEVFFLLKGKVGFYNDANRLFKSYIQGSYFGEVDILKKSLRTYKARALTEAHLVTLPRDVFMKGLKQFP
jgi:CRP-like cAMP-binding protein